MDVAFGVCGVCVGVDVEICRVECGCGNGGLVSEGVSCSCLRINRRKRLGWLRERDVGFGCCGCGDGCGVSYCYISPKKGRTLLLCEVLEICTAIESRMTKFCGHGSEMVTRIRLVADPAVS